MASTFTKPLKNGISRNRTQELDSRERFNFGTDHLSWIRLKSTFLDAVFYKRLSLLSNQTHSNILPYYGGLWSTPLSMQNRTEALVFVKWACEIRLVAFSCVSFRRGIWSPRSCIGRVAGRNKTRHSEGIVVWCTSFRAKYKVKVFLRQLLLCWDLVKNLNNMK